MKKSTLKNLALEFSNFLGEDCTNLESRIREFYFSKYGCNNSERENELLDYYLNN